ncbi:MAG: hypothetical protein JW945_02365, partial [Methanomicrobia archaeon]|nr:hypothetical protein [Methanomicrobia archaeon]
GRWRSEDSGVEKDREGLVGGVGVDRGRARTNLFLERKGLSKERILRFWIIDSKDRLDFLPCGC